MWKEVNILSTISVQNVRRVPLKELLKENVRSTHKQKINFYTLQACMVGYFGTDCRSCPFPYFGKDCLYGCNCIDGEQCNHILGCTKTQGMFMFDGPIETKL